MDACALILVGVRDIKPLQARMTFLMLRQVVVEIARSLHVSPAKRIDPPRLSAADFERLLNVLAEAGVAWNGGASAADTLEAVRATYEPLLRGLGDYLLIPVPGWIEDDDSPDHWERGPRGIIARRLIVGLAAGSISGSDGRAGKRARTFAGRLRDRLK